MLFSTSRDFYYQYELPLARVMCSVEKRGILTDPTELAKLRLHIDDELEIAIDKIATAVGKSVCLGKQDGSVNLNSPQQVIAMLQARGLKVPKSRKTGRESSAEDILFKLYGETNDEVLRSILRVRELVKIEGTYVNVELLDNVLYCSYVVAGTVTGRRSSRKNFLGLGTNGQNIPKHTKLGKMYRRCLVARPGKVFISCDQVQAEDVIVQSTIADICGYDGGVADILAGVDRHSNLASFMFSLPTKECGRGTLYRYCGKKFRHANNYGIRGNKMSAALASEGISMAPPQCDYLIERVNQADPRVRGVYQPYVESKLRSTRELITPIGRRRTFLGLRPYSDNNEVFRDGYAQIPQSTVGDNTGLAILCMESTEPGYVIADGHDAVVLEVDDNDEQVIKSLSLLQRSFDRKLTFENGYEVTIPVEVEIGYNLAELKECGRLNATSNHEIDKILSRIKTVETQTT